MSILHLFGAERDPESLKFWVKPVGGSVFYEPIYEKTQETPETGTQGLTGYSQESRHTPETLKREGETMTVTGTGAEVEVRERDDRRDGRRSRKRLRRKDGTLRPEPL